MNNSEQQCNTDIEELLKLILRLANNYIHVYLSIQVPSYRIYICSVVFMLCNKIIIIITNI